MELIGAVSQGSGPVNEDGWGMAGSRQVVSAAWVFDGVTGINGRNFLPGGSDAAWLVDCAQLHLQALAGQALALREILERLVAALIADWRAVTVGLSLPPDFDPPAACLVLAKRYDDGWQIMRLGDSVFIAGAPEGPLDKVAAPDNQFDHWLSQEARRRREEGQLDIKALLAEFRPLLIAGRKRRNRPGGYAILEADPAATDFAEFHNVGFPAALLLCTDGYYRACDTYDQYTDQELLAASADHDGVNRVLRGLRAAEFGDPHCERYLRFKPADDATAVMLRRPL